MLTDSGTYRQMAMDTGMVWLTAIDHAGLDNTINYRLKENLNSQKFSWYCKKGIAENICLPIFIHANKNIP